MATMFLAHLRRVRASSDDRRPSTVDRPTTSRVMNEIRPARARAPLATPVPLDGAPTPTDRSNATNEITTDLERTRAHARAHASASHGRSNERLRIPLSFPRVVVEGNDRGVLSVRRYTTYGFIVVERGFMGGELQDESSIRPNE